MAQMLSQIEVTFHRTGDRWGWKAVDLEASSSGFGSFTVFESKEEAERDALEKINEHVEQETLRGDELMARVRR